MNPIGILTLVALLCANPLNDKIVADLRVRLGPKQFNNHGSVDCICFSPSGQRLAVSTRGYVNIWNFADGKLCAQFKPNGQIFPQLQRIAYSNDSKYFAISRLRGLDWIVELVEVNSKKRKMVLPIGSPVYSLSFSNNSSHLSIASAGPSILVVNTITGKVEFRLSGHTKHIVSHQHSADDQYVVGICENGSAYVWSIAQKKIIKKRRFEGGFYKLSHSKNGPVVYLGEKNAIYAWDYLKNSLKLIVKDNAVMCDFAISPDESFVGISGIRSLILRDVATSKLVHRKSLRNTPGPIVFSPDGHYLVWANSSQIAIVDVQSGRYKRSDKCHVGRITGLRFSKDERSLASAAEDQKVFIWKLSSGKAVLGFDVYQSEFRERNRCVFSDCLSTAFWSDVIGKHIFRLDLSNNTQKKVIRSSHWVTSIALHPSNQIIATGNANGVVSIIESDLNKIILTSDAHNPKVVKSVAFSANGKILVSAGSDGSIAVFGGVKFQKRFQLRPKKNASQLCSYHSIAVSPEGKRVAVGADGGLVEVWNLENKSLLWRKNRHNGSIIGPENGNFCVAFSPNGKLVASAGGDRRVAVFNADSGNIQFLLKGHTAGISALEFAPSGQYIAVGCADSTIVVWHLKK